jgi:hypothetical protein
MRPYETLWTSYLTPSRPHVPASQTQSKTIFVLRDHGLRTPREEMAFTARPKIQSQSQIFRYGRSIFCLPHRPNFSDIFDLFHHWVSVVRVRDYPFKTSVNCHYFWPLPPYVGSFFTIIRWQIWPIFDPFTPTNCQRFKWMVPYWLFFVRSTYKKVQNHSPKHYSQKREDAQERSDSAPLFWDLNQSEKLS